MQQFLWAVETAEGDGNWHLLPNTIHVRHYHAFFDLTTLRADMREHNLQFDRQRKDKYRIAKYQRVR